MLNSMLTTTKIFVKQNNGDHQANIATKDIP